MPLLRRPDDHRRVLRARRRTACPAIAPSRGRDAMTAVLTLSRRPPAGGRFWCRSPLHHGPTNADATPPIVADHTVKCSGGDQFSMMDGSPPSPTPPAHPSPKPLPEIKSP
jgi:hypothetical protein